VQQKSETLTLMVKFRFEAKKKPTTFKKNAAGEIQIRGNL